MRMRKSGLIVLLALALCACGGTPEEAAESSARVESSARIPIDHHVHILSPTLVADWKSLGVPFSKPDDAYVSAAGLLGGPDSGDAILDHALLIPMAHFYASSELRGALGLSLEEEQAKVRGENEYVAAEAARYPGRATALCSIPILRPYADEELRHCVETLGARALKIHFASSEVDLREEKNLVRLEDVFGRAERERIPMLIHFDPQIRGHEIEHVERFIDRVLAPHPNLEIVIAHLGGSGGYGEWTASVFRTFADWLAAEQARGVPRAGVKFDISAVVLEEESEGVPATTDEEAAGLAADLRRVGFERIVFGSDYPVFQPADVLRSLKQRLDLTPSEVDALLGNRLPGVETASSG